MKNLEELDNWYDENIAEFDADQLEIIDFLIDTTKEYFGGMNRIVNMEEVQKENKKLKQIIKVLEAENIRVVNLDIDKNTTTEAKRKVLMERLNMCTKKTVETFKRLYGGIAVIPDYKLDRALIQVEKALEKEKSPVANLPAKEFND